MAETPADRIQELLDFIAACPTAFQCAEELGTRFAQAGYRRLAEDEAWKLNAGESYFVERNDSALVAFRLGTESPAESGFRIVGTHTDSPALKIKLEGENTSGGCVRITTEVYGGPILATWLDRPLSIAGRVLLDTPSGLASRRVDLREPITIIPNLALHYNREVNKGFEYNTQQHLPAIISGTGGTGAGQVLRTHLGDKLGVLPQSILQGDLFLYDPGPGVRLGVNGEFLNAPRIDNLAMCHALSEAMLSLPPTASAAVGVFTDNEEVGSRTPQGADSSFISDILQRISLIVDGEADAAFRARARSAMISADAAHGVHPNFADRHDPQYAPLLNGGPCIKAGAGFRYATTARTAAEFERLCRSNGIPVQTIINRSDIPSGSTIGPMSSAHLGIAGLDVGNPILAMHSIRETAGTKDHALMIRALEFFLQNPAG